MSGIFAPLPPVSVKACTPLNGGIYSKRAAYPIWTGCPLCFSFLKSVLLSWGAVVSGNARPHAPPCRGDRLSSTHTARSGTPLFCVATGHLDVSPVRRDFPTAKQKAAIPEDSGRVSNCVDVRYNCQCIPQRLQNFKQSVDLRCGFHALQAGDSRLLYPGQLCQLLL